MSTLFPYTTLFRSAEIGIAAVFGIDRVRTNSKHRHGEHQTGMDVIADVRNSAISDGNVSIGNGAISDIGDHIHSSLMFAMSVLTVGSHTINAEYSGDANFSRSEERRVGKESRHTGDMLV